MLILILIAVALFAALSYVVTQSARSSGSGITRENARLHAASIIGFAGTTRSTIHRMMFTNNCAENMLDFSNVTYKRNDGTVLNNTNNRAPVSMKCHVFEAAGGAVPTFVPNEDALVLNDPLMTSTQGRPGHAGFRVMQIMGLGTDAAAGTTSANDLYFVVPRLKREVCLAVNEMLKVDNPSGNPPDVPATGQGSYTNGSFTATGIMTGPAIDGKDMFCRYVALENSYHFHMVVLER